MLTFLLGLAYAIASTAWVLFGHHVSPANLIIAAWLVAGFAALALIRQAQYVHLSRAVIASQAGNEELL